jgi:hypothetical protein
LDYNINEIGNELDILSTEEKSGDNINYKEDSLTKINYMNPLNIFKIPLSFAGTNIFYGDFRKLNKNTSDEMVTNDYRIKYLIKFNNISSIETEVIISLQDDPSIVIFRFKDKLIVIPKLDKNEILIERNIM